MNPPRSDARPAAESDTLSVPPDGRPDAVQPRWRQDFPIDWPEDEYISRRDFVKFMGLVSLSFTVGQFWILAQHLLGERAPAPTALDLGSVDDMAPGSARLFAYPTERDPALLVRMEDGGFVAYDQRCTHLSCPVTPQPEAGRLHCPCHEGIFDLATGQPLAGPPQRPLRRITLETRDGHLFATGIEEGLA
jgi:nitrite reductase/ring-hydroxylating ferredoxin subunit